MYTYIYTHIHIIRALKEGALGNLEVLQSQTFAESASVTAHLGREHRDRESSIHACAHTYLCKNNLYIYVHVYI